LQKYYGTAADTHMRDTRTGVKKGTFWTFYSEARKKAYKKKNIESAWRKTGIYPFNPDEVLANLVPVSRADPATPSCTSTILRTPKNRHQLRQQTLAAVQKVATGNSSTEDTIALVFRLSHLAETALTAAEIEKITTHDLRTRYAGKKAAQTDKRVLSKARAITGKTIAHLRKERIAKDEENARKAAARGKRASKPKPATIPAPVKKPAPKQATAKANPPLIPFDNLH
jgi:hypothetical protein